MYKSGFAVVFFGSALALTSGCAQNPVQPWEKSILAQPDMTFEANAIEGLLNDHFYSSKEASSGGRSFAGGGCGCN